MNSIKLCQEKSLHWIHNMNRHITAAALPNRLVVSPTDWLFLDIVSTHPLLLLWLPTTVAFSCLFISCNSVLVYWCCYISFWQLPCCFCIVSYILKTMNLFSPERFVVIATVVLPLSFHLLSSFKECILLSFVQPTFFVKVIWNMLAKGIKGK